MMHALLAAATIPTPSPAQLRYMATDFIALIHIDKIVEGVAIRIAELVDLG